LDPGGSVLSTSILRRDTFAFHDVNRLGSRRPYSFRGSITRLAHSPLYASPRGSLHDTQEVATRWMDSFRGRTIDLQVSLLSITIHLPSLPSFRWRTNGRMSRGAKRRRIHPGVGHYATRFLPLAFATAIRARAAVNKSSPVAQFGPITATPALIVKEKVPASNSITVRSAKFLSVSATSRAA
jgi:hypothetical protein